MVAVEILAGGIAGVLSNATGYLITGVVFHPYQAHTPATWRTPESWTHYTYASVLRICACVAIALFYGALAATGPAAMGSLAGSAGFGAVLWVAVAGPLILETSLFVKWHPGFVAGLLLDWLVLCVLASVAGSIAR
jgi:hypothetical protein